MHAVRLAAPSRAVFAGRGRRGTPSRERHLEGGGSCKQQTLRTITSGNNRDLPRGASMADAGSRSEVKPVVQPRMSLAKMKQNKLQKTQALVRHNSGDAANSMMMSRDFQSDPGAAAAPAVTSTAVSRPVQRTRSVTFSQDALYRSSVDSAGSSPDIQPDSPFASEASVLGVVTSSDVFNAKGEMQVDSDREDDYEDGDTQAALRASKTFAAPVVPRPAAMLLGDFSAVPVQRYDPAPGSSPPVSPSGLSALSSESVTSMNCSVDLEDAKDVGMVQTDWMAVADERYAQKQDMRKLEVRFRSVYPLCRDDHAQADRAVSPAAQDMLAKMSSQMEALLNASAPKPQAAPVAVPQPEIHLSVAAPTLGAAEIDVVSSRELKERLKSGRQSPIGCGFEVQPPRAVSPEFRPSQERERPLPGSGAARYQPNSTTANVVAQIHSLALLLDPEGLSAAVEELQTMQAGMEGVEIGLGGAGGILPPGLPALGEGQEEEEEEEQSSSLLSSAAKLWHPRLAQTKRPVRYTTPSPSLLI